MAFTTSGLNPALVQARSLDENKGEKLEECMVFGYLLFGGIKSAVSHTIRKRSPGGQCPVFWLLPIL